MRTAGIVSAIVLLACSDPSPSPAAATPAVTPAAMAPIGPSPEPSTSTSTSTSTPSITVPSPRAPRLEISDATAADVQRLVREARALEHDGDHAAALARFDEALRLVPSQPRVLCEAGFIAHRAGDDALAARRIDAALAVFGDPRRVSDRLRVPLAMCLYNRGIVAEAEPDPRRAVEVLEASLALRPNATVEAALARARTAVAALPPTARPTPPAVVDLGTVGGVPLTSDYTLATTDVARYERALASGMRGAVWDGTYFPASETSVTRHPVATDGHPAVLVHVVSHPAASTRLVISWPLASGYQAQDLTIGEPADDAGVEQALTVSEVRGSWVGDVLRVDVTVAQHIATRLFYAGDLEDERCEDGTDEDVTRQWSVLCRVEDGDSELLTCTDVATRVESSGMTSYSDCGNDATEDETTPATLARAVLTISPTGMTISQLRDDEGVLGQEEGTVSWDDAFLSGGPNVMLTEWVSDDE